MQLYDLYVHVVYHSCGFVLVGKLMQISPNMEHIVYVPHFLQECIYCTILIISVISSDSNSPYPSDRSDDHLGHPLVQQ